MKLRIVTPLSVVVDEDGVQALRAEDASGGFGILRGHADFLPVSRYRWSHGDAGTERNAAAPCVMAC